MKPIFLFLLLSAALRLTAQASAIFPPERYDELRQEVVFEYPDKVEAPEPVANPFEDLDLSTLRNPLIWTIGTLVVLGLGFLVYRILHDLELKKRAARKSVNEGVAVEEIVEEQLVASGVSLTMLERAEAAGQYAIAVRLLYIALLKALQDTKMIRYRKDFSNRDYRRQLAHNELRADFVKVTQAYERYWYGKYPIDRLSYRVTQRAFNELSDRIATSHPNPAKA